MVPLNTFTQGLLVTTLYSEKLINLPCLFLQCQFNMYLKYPLPASLKKTPVHHSSSIPHTY